MGRKPQTGIHATRAALEASVVDDYRRNSVAQVAKLNGISVALAHQILNRMFQARANPNPSSRPE